MSKTAHLHLFEGYGIELEFMIVNRDTLKAMPIADKVLESLAGAPAMEVAEGTIAWSNELVKHVLELKSNGPAKDLKTLRIEMNQSIVRMNAHLATFGARLMPTAMHPLFVPDVETVIWDAENVEIYQTYDKIFGCKGHGWSNLQSIHINLPFFDDAEFGRLHAAVRLVLPLLPAIAASSPFQEGKRGPLLDTRLFHYLQNQRRIPEIIGSVIPERAFSERDYGAKILEPMYKAIAPYDPEGELQDEWLNSRAAIARFQRHAIEIRLLDIQECNRANFAIIEMVVASVRNLVEETWSSFELQKTVDETRLKALLLQVLETGLDTKISDETILAGLGFTVETTVRGFWERIVGQTSDTNSSAKDFAMILKGDCLAKRLVEHLGTEPSSQEFIATYLELSRCLEMDAFFGVK